jgi:hypothetical protein
MVAFRRPTTYRTLNRHIPVVAQSFQRIGEAPFDSAARTHLVRTRRAGGLLDWRDVQRGRNTTYSGKNRANVTPTPQSQLLIRRLPGKPPRRFTPVLSKWNGLRMR